MLSASFTNWVATLDATERVLVPAKRSESLREFFASRSTK